MDLWNKKISPMLLDEINKPFDSKDFLFEIKFDGIRALINVSPNTFKITSRNGIDLTKNYIELKNIQNNIKDKIIFDGEIVVFNNNKPSFTNVLKRLRTKDKNKINSQAKNNPTTFICFDILYLNKNITKLPLIKRKEILNQFEDTEYFVKTKYILNNGKRLFKEIKKIDLEGIVAKKINSQYEIDKRSKEWIKIKNYKEEVFYVVGYTYKENSNVFSVILGEYINKKLCCVGKVFIVKRNSLFKKILNEKEIKSKDLNNKNIHYIKPKYRCKVKYIERTESNNLRQPFYVKTMEEK